MSSGRTLNLRSTSVVSVDLPHQVDKNPTHPPAEHCGQTQQ